MGWEKRTGIIGTIDKVPLRDVGEVKSRGWRKLKRDTQVRQVAKACYTGGNNKAWAAVLLYSTVQ